MSERFTNRAKRVMALANQEARRLNHEYLGTEHILLGLLQERSGFGAKVLSNLRINLELARRKVEQLVNRGPNPVLMGKLPQTPRAKKAIAYAILEAQSLNHNYVATGHLLLGLIRQDTGTAAQVLMNLGLTLERVREEVLNLLGAEIDATEPPVPSEKVDEKVDLLSENEQPKFDGIRAAVLCEQIGERLIWLAQELKKLG